MRCRTKFETFVRQFYKKIGRDGYGFIVSLINSLRVARLRVGKDNYECIKFKECMLDEATVRAEFLLFNTSTGKRVAESVISVDSAIQNSRGKRLEFLNPWNINIREFTSQDEKIYKIVKPRIQQLDLEGSNHLLDMKIAEESGAGVSPARMLLAM